jgi:formylglycine-generating enzyme required for sulfatase activity
MRKTCLRFLRRPKKAAFIFLVSVCLIQCDASDPYDDPAPFIFTGTYNLVEVPVPQGGIDFPIGIDDDDTARVEKAYYIGETEITNALWDTVSRWAVNEKELGKYAGLVYGHHKGYEAAGNVPITDEFAVGHNSMYGYSALIGPFYAVPVWCNAFTEWYNEQYGTNLTPVYQDSHGNPIRYLNNYDNFMETENPNATGFRLPTAEEWELAARWNGGSVNNTVTKTINNIDFSNQPIRFTTGRSASGAENNVDNFDENDRVAFWKNNSSTTTYYSTSPYSVYDSSPVKGKKPNVLGLYDMSGNVREITSAFEHAWTWGIDDYIIVQCRGGCAASDSDELAVGKLYGVSYASGYNIGFRVVRNAE